MGLTFDPTVGAGSILAAIAIVGAIAFVHWRTRAWLVRFEAKLDQLLARLK